MPLYVSFKKCFLTNGETLIEVKVKTRTYAIICLFSTIRCYVILNEVDSVTALGNIENIASSRIVN